MKSRANAERQQESNHALQFTPRPCAIFKVHLVLRPVVQFPHIALELFDVLSRELVKVARYRG